MAVALGIFVQHEYTLMPPPPDATAGWKEQIRKDYGTRMTDRLTQEKYGAGACVITITPSAN